MTTTGSMLGLRLSVKTRHNRIARNNLYYSQNIPKRVSSRTIKTLHFGSWIFGNLFSAVVLLLLIHDGLCDLTVSVTSDSIVSTAGTGVLPTLENVSDQSDLLQQLRLNVVEENPTLDVGPLMQITIARGEKARLPCIHRNLDPNNNKVRLVLWYRNDTSRPFISFDARANVESREQLLNFSRGLPTWSGRVTSEIGRVFLEENGQTLSIVDVVEEDQAEYRCTVHYSNSPSVTRRLKLIVVEAVQRVQLLDGDGHPVGAHVGPFSEGSNLNITCKAYFSCQIVSIEWQVEGKPIRSKWRQPKQGVALSSLYWDLTHNHSLYTLTCRLICNTTNAGTINASIVDASTTIIMYFVPKASLFVNSAFKSSGKGVSKGNSAFYRVKEGHEIAFNCVIKARPPPYKVAWLHNGKIIAPSERLIVKHNKTLILSPASKEDAGLYTCLASNREGDGHSNAVSLKVDHSPYCLGEKEETVVAIKNKPVKLSCTFAAQPQKMNFSWSFEPALPVPKPTVKYSPKMQRYTPNPVTEEDRETEEFLEMFSKIVYSTEKRNPKVSHLTFTPRYNNQGVFCYARNEIGRTKSPCRFILKLVDPPDPPEKCRFERVTPSQLHVTCILRIFPPQTLNTSEQSAPGISYVLSPEARKSAHLEVWSKDNLFANLSNDQPNWLVDDLAGQSDLTLRVYAASQYAHSSYVDLQVDPGLFLSPGKGKKQPTNRGEAEDIAFFAITISSNIFILLGSLFGGVIILLLLLFTVLFIIRRRSLSRRENILSVDETSPRGSNVALEENSEELENISVKDLKDPGGASDDHSETEA